MVAQANTKSETAPSAKRVMARSSVKRHPKKEAKLVAVNATNDERIKSQQKGPDTAKAEHDKALLRIQRLEHLLTFESQVRDVASLKELFFFVANEALHLTSASQIFVAKRRYGSKVRLRVCTASNLSSLDANAPTVVSMEQQFSRVLQDALARDEEGRRTPYVFSLRADGSNPSQQPRETQYDNAVMVPVFDVKDRVIGCVVFTNADDGVSKELAIIKRLGEVTQFAWQALAPARSFASFFSIKKGLALLCLLAVLAGTFIRVPLSTLAPVEIVASEPEVVAAPINGVIRKILVDGNAVVEKGTPLFQYEDTVLLSELEIAKQAWSVANAKLKKAQQSSFGLGNGKRELTIATAELDLAFAELQFAKAQYSKTMVTAPKDGVVILDRKSDWQGKPVSVGQRVLEIAQTSNIEARIDLAVSDAIVLEEKAPVQLYLDTNPLHALDGQVVSASYRASLDVANELSFTVTAKLEETIEERPRIGARGTAQVYGEEVSLGFYLFRRPLAAIRQWVGW